MSPIAIRFCSAVAATVLLITSFCPRIAFATDAARPLSSLTADERMRLPDNTMVKLASGKSASLGTLRAEHKARLERFANAEALGRSVAARLAPIPSNSPQQAPAAGAKRRISPNPPPVSASAAGAALPSGSATMKAGMTIPFQPPTYQGAIAKDYVEFCKAANASICIYLPVTRMDLRLFESKTWASDDDPFIVDKSVCDFGGGVLDQNGCHFFYPTTQLVNFIPTGPLVVTGACGKDLLYLVDPKGAMKAWMPIPDYGNYLGYDYVLSCVLNGRINIK